MSDFVRLKKAVVRENGRRVRVVFGGEEFEVDATAFMECSARYKDELLDGKRDFSAPVNVMANVTRESLLEFISLCQGGSVELTFSNAGDLWLLADEWGVGELSEAASQFVNKHGGEVLLDALLKRVRNNESTQEMEVLVNRDFLKLCGNRYWLENGWKLGLALLARVLAVNDYEIVRCHIHEVFDFLMKCAEKCGPCAWVLFYGVDYASFNERELIMLKENKFDESVLSGNALETIQRQMETIREYQELSRNMDEKAAALTARVESLEKEVAELRKLLTHRLATVERDVSKGIKEVREQIKNTEAKHARNLDTLRDDVSKGIKEVKEQIKNTEAKHARNLDTLRDDVSRKHSEIDASIERESKRVGLAIDQTKKVESSILTCVSSSMKVILYQSNPLSGVIAHLTRECRGNVHERKVVEVKGSSLVVPVGSVKYDLDKPENAVVLDDDEGAFYSGHFENSYLQYDFKDKQLIVTGYTIKPAKRHPESCPKSWDLLGLTSEDDPDTIIDSKRDDMTMSSAGSVPQYFPIQSPTATPFRFFRLRQVGKNANDLNYQLIINCFELFGVLLTPQ